MNKLLEGYEKLKSQILELQKPAKMLNEQINDKDYLGVMIQAEEIMQSLIVLGRTRKELFYMIKDIKNISSKKMETINVNK